ncbi:MAG: ATP-binding protein [Rhodospirillales bacterium]
MDAALAIGLGSIGMGLLAAAFLRERRRTRVLARRLAACTAHVQSLMRLAKLTAADLRGPALSLLGHAEHAQAPLKSTLVGVCRYLLDLAEALLDQTEDPDTARTLREEAVELGPLLDFTVAQVAAQLGPGRRAWRLGAGLDQVTLLADRRALHQVLLRVLTGAALATGDGDLIEISAAEEGGCWTLRIEDEGNGLAVPRVAGVGTETRGVGLGLALARSLMLAHGGALAMDSTAQVGTRASLRFPPTRVVAGNGYAPNF